MSDDWTPVARRGECTMLVITRRDAQERGKPLTDGAKFFGIVKSPDQDAVGVLFLSLPLLMTFCQQMQPREIQIQCGMNENAASLHALLDRAVGVALH